MDDRKLRNRFSSANFLRFLFSGDVCSKRFDSLQLFASPELLIRHNRDQSTNAHFFITFNLHPSDDRISFSLVRFVNRSPIHRLIAQAI